ncbi:MAG: DUF4412 domain-containing protein [candidate division WOR-3 bacterium]
MLKRSIKVYVFLIIILTGFAFAGLQWQMVVKSESMGKQSKMKMQIYAQKGNVREEFIEVDRSEGILNTPGAYWLYRGNENSIYIVNPKEKNYLTMNLDSIQQAASTMMQQVQIKVNNLKVDVKQLPSEVVAGYKCKHININTSYDLEMNFSGMNMKTKVERSEEVWGTSSISTSELADAFRRKTFKTGIKDIDSLVQINIESQKDLGFIIKIVNVEKTTDFSGRTTTRKTESTNLNIITKSLPNNLFSIPKDYKMVNLKRSTKTNMD